jgi:hypothetical protein
MIYAAKLIGQALSGVQHTTFNSERVVIGGTLPGKALAPYAYAVIVFRK